MRITVFQHVQNEPLGAFETIFDEKGIPYEYVPLYETGEVPSVDASHLIFLGGPMSVNDEDEYPYLRQEKALIREYVGRSRPVLGICLGAQLIADACGGSVYPAAEEVGWYEMRTTKAGALAWFPERFRVFELHGETFDVPPGGTLLAVGDPVRNQAFAYGNALALQFHLEPTEAMIENWVRDRPAPEREAIHRDTAAYLEETSRLCRLIADGFLER